MSESRLKEQAWNRARVPTVANPNRTSVLRRRLEDESRRRAGGGTTIRDSVQLRHARARSLLRSHCSARGPRRDRAAGRGWQDIHTLSFSSPKTTHALRGAVGPPLQCSETEDPEPDPGHGRRVDGTFDEGRPHAGRFLSERTNRIYTRSRKWRLRLGRPRHRLDRDSYVRIFVAARARRPCGHGKLELCSPLSACRRHRARICRALRRVPLILYVVAAATSFVRGRLISRRARHDSAALLLCCCSAAAGRPLVF